MTSKQIKIIDDSSIKSDLKFVNKLVTEQRLQKYKSIEACHKEHKRHLHSSEYKLLVSLLKNLEKSLLIEYLFYLNSDDSNTYILFDVWAMDKLATAYSQS